MDFVTSGLRSALTNTDEPGCAVVSIRVYRVEVLRKCALHTRLFSGRRGHAFWGRFERGNESANITFICNLQRGKMTVFTLPKTRLIWGFFGGRRGGRLRRPGLRSRTGAGARATPVIVREIPPDPVPTLVWGLQGLGSPHAAPRPTRAKRQHQRFPLRPRSRHRRADAVDVGQGGRPPENERDIPLLVVTAGCRRTGPFALSRGGEVRHRHHGDSKQAGTRPPHSAQVITALREHSCLAT